MFPGPVPGREHRGAHAAARAVAEQVRPRLGRLAVPVGQGDELLAAIGADPDHHQQAQLVLGQPDVQQRFMWTYRQTYRQDSQLGVPAEA